MSMIHQGRISAPSIFILNAVRFLRLRRAFSNIEHKKIKIVNYMIIIFIWLLFVYYNET